MTRRTGLFAVLVLVCAGAIAATIAAVSQSSVRPANSVVDAYAPKSTVTPVPPVEVQPVASLVTPFPGAATALSAEPALPVRFAVPAVAIDAAVVEAGLDQNGNMADPEGPDDVAWYSFTARPGGGGNAVFSGHLDWYASGPAVFWRMRELAPGDRISLTLADGTAASYAVAWSRTYPLNETPMALALEATSVEAITIITCAGDFIDGDYTDRMIIRAFRTGD